jgi:osmotically-inducible protein OsmY
MSTAQLSLRDQVESVLGRSPYFSHRALRCEAQDRRVVLRGVVKSYYQKQMAQEVVRQVDGVDEIENQLVVNWT